MCLANSRKTPASPHRTSCIMISARKCCSMRLRATTSASLLTARQELANPIPWWESRRRDRKESFPWFVLLRHRHWGFSRCLMQPVPFDHWMIRSRNQSLVRFLPYRDRSYQFFSHFLLSSLFWRQLYVSSWDDMLGQPALQWAGRAERVNFKALPG